MTPGYPAGICWGIMPCMGWACMVGCCAGAAGVGAGAGAAHAAHQPLDLFLAHLPTIAGRCRRSRRRGRCAHAAHQPLDFLLAHLPTIAGRRRRSRRRGRCAHAAHQPLDLLLAHLPAIAGRRRRGRSRFGSRSRGRFTGQAADIHTKAAQQFPGQIYRHHIDELTVQHIFNAQCEPDDHQHPIGCLEMILFELLDIIQGEGLGGGDIHRAPQEIGQRRGRCAHHLVHDLADGADGQLIELEFLIRGFAAHEDIHDHLHIAPV